MKNISSPLPRLHTKRFEQYVRHELDTNSIAWIPVNRAIGRKNDEAVDSTIERMKDEFLAMQAGTDRTQNLNPKGKSQPKPVNCDPGA